MLDSLGRDWTRSANLRSMSTVDGMKMLVPEDTSDAVAIAQLNAIIANPEPARLAAIDQVLQSDATIQQLRAMDVATFDAWWAANVTSLAQANNILKRLTRLALRQLV